MEEIVITKEYAKTLLPERVQNSHKGTYGNVLNIAGSLNYRGAAYLSTKAVLKSGAGYVSLASLNEVINMVSTLCPEAVFLPLEQKNGTICAEAYKKIIPILPKFKVLMFGCGLGSLNNDNTEVIKFVKNFIGKIKNLETPVIIDADGLNIISELNIDNLPKNPILTPHPMELSRLIGEDVSEIQNNRTKYAVKTAKKYNSTVVLKGANTVITDGERVYVNKSGNSALAKAGSGDVLSGMIAGFSAQGASSFESTILGVYLHGLAGEIASKELTQYSVNASDLLEYIPNAIKTLTD